MRHTTVCQCLVLLGLFGAWHIGGWQQPTITRQTLETISLCELTKDWKKYDHSTVRIEAVYATGAENSEVYDVACPSGDNAAWVEFPAAIEKAAAREITDKLKQLLRTDSRARVVVVGEFAGPKRVDISPNTPPKVAEAMRAVNSRYGHQNHWDFQFVFSKIEKVEPVPASDPWPRWATGKKN
jgi:hypothetical protein